MVAQSSSRAAINANRSPGGQVKQPLRMPPTICTTLVTCSPSSVLAFLFAYYAPRNL